MSLLAATQVTAVATAVLALFAIITAIFAFLAFRKQAEEVSTLQRQAERDVKQRHRDQATHVYVWAEPRPMDNNPADMRPAACLKNASAQPIYDIRLGWTETAQGGQPVLMPGGEFVIPGAGTVVADGKVPVWAEFRDAAGVRWRATSRGELTE